MWHCAQDLNTHLARESKYLEKIWRDEVDLVTGITRWQYAAYLSHQTG